ncbi:AGE family epimerase/isomerase [Lapillicoccus jejuensis]|uniref:Mannose/cellobiose epimerase-like protein (N-acyl-D-glucosamine 2-epimerase family) n=1 Tax=Lapillicoccus jejuensis TaxID=402171 RepID=A0A542DWR8_9MICO|nr:AGE family epimerase/isomerase [Lapillicoccus jejuensis]TQJ07531.1 mannose/cellobiose epimerase-like protein (N-acyl-D-glucosamine 2-epimerase family) [Lapillicoccus jejuensis]
MPASPSSTPALPPEDQRWLEAQAASLLDFTRGAAHPDGGFGWLDDDGRVEAGRPVELWITCRMTHVLGLAAIAGDEGARDLVDHGVRALRGRLHDDEHGGWYAAVETGPDGASRPADDTKQAYAHAFVVLAAATATAVGHPQAPALLDEALATWERFWSEEDGLAADVWDRTFTTLDPYRGVNANMHSVEALLAAHDVTGDPVPLQRALRITGRVVHEFAASNGYRLPEHYDEQWNRRLDYNRDHPADKFRPYGVTIGHLLEWARLALHVRTALTRAGADVPDWLLQDAMALTARGVEDGWAVDGRDGFVYTTDFDAAPVVRDRLHWVAAEAMATSWTLAVVTGEASYGQDWQRWRAHVDALFVDAERGSWRHELDQDNRPSSHVWEGKPDTYHAYQAVILPFLGETSSFVAGVRDRAVERS